LRWPHCTRQILVCKSTTGSRCRRFGRCNGTERRALASSQWPNDAPPLHFHCRRPPLVTSFTSLQYILWRDPYRVLSFLTITSSRQSLQLKNRHRLDSYVSFKSAVSNSTRKIKTEMTIAAISRSSLLQFVRRQLRRKYDTTTTVDR